MRWSSLVPPVVLLGVTIVYAWPLVGALMVTALALILDAALAFAVWASVPGTGRLRSMPQPLLGDEVALESGSRGKSSFSARSEQGDPSPTVDG